MTRMNHLKKYAGLALLFLIAFIFPLQSQTNASQIIRGVSAKLQKVNDYTVMANVKVDMPFIRMLPIDAKIYYKQKGKFKVESKSIAIVPRQGFDQSSRMLADTNSFTAIIQGTDVINGTTVSIVNIIPLTDTSDLILGKLWIDTKQNVVLKSQLTTKSNGTILTEYTYGSQIAYGLPDKMVFSVDVKKFKIPKSVSADINNSSTDNPDKSKDNKKGQIFIVLTNYQVNKGIPDTVFKK